MVETYRREMVDDGAMRGALAWYRALPLTSLRSVPSIVSVPTTLIWSDRDIAITRKSVDLTERFVDRRLPARGDGRASATGFPTRSRPSSPRSSPERVGLDAA